MSQECHIALLADVGWAAWEIIPDKVQGLGCTLGDGVNLIDHQTV